MRGANCIGPREKVVCPRGIVPAASGLSPETALVVFRALAWWGKFASFPYRSTPSDSSVKKPYCRCPQFLYEYVCPQLGSFFCAPSQLHAVSLVLLVTARRPVCWYRRAPGSGQRLSDSADNPNQARKVKNRQRRIPVPCFPRRGHLGGQYQRGATQRCGHANGESGRCLQSCQQHSSEFGRQSEGNAIFEEGCRKRKLGLSRRAGLSRCAGEGSVPGSRQSLSPGQGSGPGGRHPQNQACPTPTGVTGPGLRAKVG